MNEQPMHEQPAREPIRLMLADDHPVVRAGLRAVLEAEPDFAVVAEVASGEEAIATVGATPCHVVLMDLEFGGGMRGHRATAEITAAPGGPQVLVLTTYDSDADILAALDAGAIGALRKDAPPDELAHALREAAGGRMTLSPPVAGRLDSRSRRSATTLSPREIEVLQLVADGLGNQEIAAQLFLSQATVKSHLAHIYTKFDVESRTAAVALATERGLL